MISNLKQKLSRTRETLKTRFDDILRSNKSREEILDDLTESLILADVGVNSSEKIIAFLRQKSRKNDPPAAIKKHLEEEVIHLLSQYPTEIKLNSSGSVLMFVGVNGGGKTTSLAKLAYKYKDEGKDVLMVAADTFRAAAQEQLSLWGKKLNIPVIVGPYGADPASVTYDAIQSFKAKDYNVLLVDTAGRIHTNTNLMNELEKIKKIG